MVAFFQVSQSRLYEAGNNAAGSGVTGWCAYLLGPDDKITTITSPISLDDALNTFGGTFLFAPVAPSAESDILTFISQVQSWLPPSGRCCLWIPDATSNPPVFGCENYNSLNSSQFYFPFANSSSSGQPAITTTKPFNPSFGKNVALTIPENVSINVSPNKSSTGADDCLNLMILGGNLPMSLSLPDGVQIQSPQTAVIPLSGQSAGCIVVGGTFSIAANPSNGPPGTPTTTDAFLGLQYNYYNNKNSGTPVLSQRFPVLKFIPGTTNVNDSSAAYSAYSYRCVGTFDPLDSICTGKASNPVNGVYRTMITQSMPDTDTPLVTFPSWLRTAFGEDITLCAQATGNSRLGPSPFDGGFIFQPVTQLTMNDNSGGNGLVAPAYLYLAPAGNYTVSVENETGVVDLLCGLSGTETIQLHGHANEGTVTPDILRFVGCQPAYTPQYPFPVADLSTPLSGIPAAPLPATTPLRYLTSWAQVVAGDGNVPSSGNAPSYRAQPQGSTLYGPDSNSNPWLSALQPLTPLTTANSPINSAIFPMVPWTGVDWKSPSIPTDPTNSQGSWTDYESKVLSATRRNAIQSLAKPALQTAKAARAESRSFAALDVDAIVPNGATPQGLLAVLETLSATTHYEAVILGQSSDTSQMAFLELNAELQGLFQTNQLFAVITDNTNLGAFTTNTSPVQNSVNIAGWTMTANVGSTNASSNVSNVLIMKFCVGTLVDLVAKPNAWVDPADFSTTPSSNTTIGFSVLSQALSTYVASAIAAANGSDDPAYPIAPNPLFNNFAAIAQDPNWQGIIVLAADVAISGLPPQLAGLAAGIVASDFRAHHFGVTVSPIHYSNGQLNNPTQSSFFALVDYQLPAYSSNVAAGGSKTMPISIPGIGAYGFNVLQLQALFVNSALVNFNSYVQVTFNQLFGSAITASYAGGFQLASNSVVLAGSYQGDGSGGTTGGTYLFEGDTATVFVPDSNVLDSVVLTKLTFNTLTANNGGNPPQILSRILTWGSLDFATLITSASSGPPPTTATQFDIMSYGMDAGAPSSQATGGLNFSNLVLNLSSPVSSPNVVTYQIDEMNLAFNLSGSLLRSGSLVSDLTLQPQSFLVVPAGTTPANLGFLPVVLDQAGLSQATVTTAYYGISCLVNMGGPGALASAAGFNSNLLLAWSPQNTRNAKSYAVFVGLSLPGASPGASAFSLQGVVKLTVGDLSVSISDTSDGEPAFLLCLRNIALSFLGMAKLPQSSSINMYLFGSPDGTGSLGWYAAYTE